jgi:predicted glycosyltransferase
MIFAGPFMAEDDFQTLVSAADERMNVRRFTADFLSYLAAADLSVSMAGYNTCMNIFAAKTPALIWPFAQNREQGMRAERLAGTGAVEIITDRDLEKNRMAQKIRAALSRNWRFSAHIDLGGALKTAQWFNREIAGHRK